MLHKYLYTAILFSIILFGCNNNKAQNSGGVINPNDTINEKIMSNSSMLYLFVGTYTLGDSEGVYVYEFDTISGESQYRSSLKIDNPSYLTIGRGGKSVYAVTENNNNTASANTLEFNKKDGAVTLVNTQLTGGADPCYITVDKEGKHVITANYSGGNMTLFKVGENGELGVASQVINFSGKGVNAERQNAPHIHCVQYSPDEKYLFATDLGTDRIYKFKVSNDSANYLTPGEPAYFKVADGSGPRHFDFHPSGKYVYLLNELSGSVIAFNYIKETGDLREFQTVQADTLNAGGSADIHVSPDGKFLYTSHRLEGDGIAIFSINQLDGSLTKVGFQSTNKHPRNFVITPNGKFLLVASRDDNTIQVFQVDQSSGLLDDIHKNIEVDMPVCLKFIL